MESSCIAHVVKSKNYLLRNYSLFDLIVDSKEDKAFFSGVAFVSSSKASCPSITSEDFLVLVTGFS